jgi:hypothetical protein
MPPPGSSSSPDNQNIGIQQICLYSAVCIYGIQLFQSERLESPRVFFSFGVSTTSKDAPLIPKANSSVTSAAMMIVTIDYGVVAIVAKWVDFGNFETPPIEAYRKDMERKIIELFFMFNPKVIIYSYC